MKKYEFINETVEFFGTNLYRIRALIDIPKAGVKAGDLGGFLQSEKNLSVYGDAWVYGDAQVYGDARVYGNARVSGNAQVYGDAQVYGNAWVYGDAWDVSPLYIQGSKWSVCVPQKGFLKVGCQCHSMEEWRTVWKDVARAHDAQDLVQEYVLYYNLAAQRYGYPLLDISDNQQQNKTEGAHDE